ncbi:FHA domain-containing protein [Microbacterium oryzae]|uniref:FHA domain-containing protein FhaB/FipA n=1 Tax=Microbacterium oryzae TaxID=743009 RepID=UPI0025B10921|nr:FHA domain-containing protein [Microbacterium oryzae]MDN3311965.1 FHA domain-containing protein [Microbacterium oryzae]
MNPLTQLLLQYGFLLVLWLFVFAVVFSLRADIFGVRVRKMPGGGAAATPAPAAPAPAAAAPAPAQSAPSSGGAGTRIVITSGPKAGLELPLGRDALTIGRSSESGLVIRDDYTSSHHARLLLRGEQWLLQDLQSTNGTFLDGHRVSPDAPVPVPFGVPVKVGATTFELRK